ncbi:hypothetical protein FJZ53_02440 [Candidatus Woesearchaeota archaeon]|nr:hypothetical protein [Candidatus Woesearchaeota archaeon]
MEQKGFMSDIVEKHPVNTADVQEILKKIKSMSQDNILEKVQQEKTDSLKKTVEDIQQLIKQREELSRTLLTDLDKIKFEVGNIITRVATELQGVESKKEQIMLKQKQVELEETKVQEKLNCWRDIAELKKELREKEQELKEKETRLEMIDDLIGG